MSYRPVIPVEERRTVALRERGMQDLKQ